MTELIYLHASEVAAAIGAAFYKSPEDVQRAVRDRKDGRAGVEDERMAALPAARLISAAAPKDRAPLRAAVARAVGTVERAHVARAVLQSAAASVTHPAVRMAGVDAGEARVVEQMMTLVPSAARPAVREAVRHVVNTERGIRAEPAIVDALEARTGAPVTDRNEAVRYLTVGGLVRVGGRTDGVDRANMSRSLTVRCAGIVHSLLVTHPELHASVSRDFEILKAIGAEIGGEEAAVRRMRRFYENLIQTVRKICPDLVSDDETSEK